MEEVWLWGRLAALPETEGAPLSIPIKDTHVGGQDTCVAPARELQRVKLFMPTKRKLGTYVFLG